MDKNQTMDVNFEYYINHYFSMPQILYFFLLALGVLFVLFVILYIYTVVKGTRYHGMQRHEYIRIEWHVLVERYYEMVFSGTSILFFMAIYYLIDRFVTIEPYRSFWDKYDDFILLVLILLSCAFNSFLDRVFVRLKFVTRDEKSAGRLTGMVYMMLIFMYIKFIYEDDNYDMLITYFITLMVGRFAYFDSTIHDFVKAMQGVFKNIWLLIFTLFYLGMMCYFGYSTDYLLTHNGVITNIFITHLFMCVAIFVLFHIHIAELVTGRGTRESKAGPVLVDTDDDYEDEMYEEEYYAEDPYMEVDEDGTYEEDYYEREEVVDDGTQYESEDLYDMDDDFEIEVIGSFKKR